MYYTYDGNGDLISMNLNNVEYYYIRNAQGDIIALSDRNGKIVVNYTYDSWGKLISISGTEKDTVGVKNPYRYRGYRYDTETGLYYLQSRYYNPEWGRFINADALGGEVGKLLSHNVFAYCMNNPINMADPEGNIAWWIVGGIVGAIGGAAYSYYTTGSVNLDTVIAGAAIGMGIGLVADAAILAYGAYTAAAAGTTAQVADKADDWIYTKGYKPQVGERTLEGFVKKNVSVDKEVALYTKSPGFNNNAKGIGGQFKRIGADSHANISPHVHQPIRNVSPKGIFGTTGRLTSNGGVTSVSRRDVKQLYVHIFINKYIP